MIFTIRTCRKQTNASRLHYAPTSGGRDGRLPSCWWLVPSLIIGSSLLVRSFWALLTAVGSLL